MADGHRERGGVIAFVLLANTLAWLWWIPVAMAGRVVRIGGWPTHVPVLMVPALAASAIAAVRTGRTGVADPWRRTTTRGDAGGRGRGRDGMLLCSSSCPSTAPSTSATQSGFTFGLASGVVVLGWLYNRT